MFFDEADALLGKRSQLRDAHDRYANQEASFLLQRVEIFDGLVILASNLATNVDEAFSRRFEQVIYFSMPSTGERQLIWQKALPADVYLQTENRLKNVGDALEVERRHDHERGALRLLTNHWPRRENSQTGGFRGRDSTGIRQGESRLTKVRRTFHDYCTRLTQSVCGSERRS